MLISKIGVLVVLVSSISALPAPVQCEVDEIDTLWSWNGDIAAVSENTLFVGVYNPAPYNVAGIVRVYEPSPTGWTQTAELGASDASVSDFFGSSIACDGETTLVGAIYASNGSLADAGAVYVFERGPAGWVETAKILPSDGANGDEFGKAVALSRDLAIIGAPRHASPGSQLYYPIGAAYVYQRTVAGWTQIAELAPSNPPYAALNSRFGSTVALRGDVALVGAPLWGWSSTFYKGRVMVYERNGGSWAEAAQLHESINTYSVDRFGCSLALGEDRALIGASGEIAAGSPGRAYVYERSPSGWIKKAALAPQDGSFKDYFGFSVGLSEDRALVGSPYEGGGVPHPGAAYLFELKNSVWGQTAKLTTPAGLELGYSCILRPDSALLGSRNAKAFMFSASAETSSSLIGVPGALSLSAGGTQSLLLKSCASHAGMNYLLVGSGSGTSPGMSISSLLLPLVPDAYFRLTLAKPAASPLIGALGTLDAAGQAQAAFAVPPGVSSNFVGLTLHHAYVVLDAGWAPVSTSSASSLSIIP